MGAAAIRDRAGSWRSVQAEALRQGWVEAIYNGIRFMELRVPQGCDNNGPAGGQPSLVREHGNARGDAAPRERS